MTKAKATPSVKKTPLRAEPIGEIYAYISCDDEGGEGILGAKFGDTYMPLVGADISRVETLRKYAESVADVRGITIKLVKFTERVEIETLTGEAPDEPEEKEVENA